MTAADVELAQLRATVAHLRETLATLILWMAQSANSPIRIAEAQALLDALEHRTRPKKPA